MQGVRGYDQGQLICAFVGAAAAILALLLSRLQARRCQSATFVMPRSIVASSNPQGLEGFSAHVPMCPQSWHWFGTSECQAVAEEANAASEYEKTIQVNSNTMMDKAVAVSPRVADLGALVAVARSTLHAVANLLLDPLTGFKIMEEFYVNQLETEAKECAKRMASFHWQRCKGKKCIE